MKAVIYTKYGSTDVLEIQDITRPVPQDNDVLVKIFATTVTPVDTTFRSGNPKFARLFTGLFKPKNAILGTELSGVIEAVGKDVTRFAVGERVFAAAPGGFGAHAQYICITENGAITKIPDSLSFEDGAVIVNGGLTALPFLRDTAKLQAGQKILIIGASGSIGTFAVQLAANLGAEVTGVCSASNVDMVRNLGARHVVDYTQTDYTKSGETYDVIFDTVGKSTFGKNCASLRKKGIFITTTPDPATIFSPLFRVLTGGKRAKMSATGLRKDADKCIDMDILKTMIATGELTTIIDRSYPLEQMATAHEYVEKGHKIGNLIITIDHPAPQI